MNEVAEFFKDLLDTSDWPARWYCGRWTDFHGWLYIISNFMVWLAYLTIPVYLFIIFRKRRKDIPILKIFWVFILFITACGFTHFFDGLIFWNPMYRVSALMLLFTAVVSWMAVYKLTRILPDAMKLASPKELETLVKQRTSDLELSNQRLSKLNEDLDHYLYAVSHNLKSPTNNLEALVNMVKKDVDASEMPDRELIDAMQKSILRLNANVNTLTTVIKSHKTPYEEEDELEIDEVVEEIVEENFELLKKAHIRKVLEKNTMHYSRAALKSILYNLLTNAVKYARPGSTPEITITTSEVEGRLQLTVSDNGLGFDTEKNRNKMFNIFTRFHDHVEGAGIGLYTIKNIIEKKGGRIEVQSEINKGTIFTVTF